MNFRGAMMHLPVMQSRSARIESETRYAKHFHSGYLREYLEWYDSRFKVIKYVIRAFGVPEPIEVEVYRNELNRRNPENE
ncbi:MAG TPA: hypothetical protein VJB05_03475 [archaeon]|nr:hypothetical protein [archaeon]